MLLLLLLLLLFRIAAKGCDRNSDRMLIARVWVHTRVVHAHIPQLSSIIHIRVYISIYTYSHDISTRVCVCVSRVHDTLHTSSGARFSAGGSSAQLERARARPRERDLCDSDLIALCSSHTESSYTPSATPQHTQAVVVDRSPCSDACTARLERAPRFRGTPHSYPEGSHHSAANARALTRTQTHTHHLSTHYRTSSVLYTILLFSRLYHIYLWVPNVLCWMSDGVRPKISPIHYKV